MNQGFYVAVALTFVAGNLIGTFLLGLALFRARVVPGWTAALVLVWPVAHILGGPWGEVLGAAVEAVGLAVVGLCLLRSGPHLDAWGPGLSADRVVAARVPKQPADASAQRGKQ